MKHLKFLLLVFLVLSAKAEDLYVRPNGSNAGSTNGSDWNNAFNGFSDIVWGSGAGAVGPGDTLWVAGGSYTQNLVIGASGTSGNLIQIKRVRSTDAVPVAAAGWNSSFDSTVVNNHAQITSSGKGYYSIDGRIDNGWMSTNGDGENSWIPSSCTGPVSGQYMTFIGPGWGRFCGYGININGSAGHYFGHIKFDGIIQQFSTGSGNLTVEYCTFLNAGPGTTTPPDTTECHSDLIYIGGASNITVRYCYFYNSFSQGFFFDYGGSSGIYIYGNVADKGPLGSGNFIWTKQGFTWGDFHIFNNTFIGWVDAIKFDGASTAASEVKNNIFWQNVNGPNIVGNWPNVTSNWNQYSTAKQDSGAQSVGNIANPFIGTGTAPQNYQLAAGKAPINAGTNLGPPYNFDMNGNSRGADGAWDVGAFEFQGGAADTTAPTLLSSTISPGGTVLTRVFSEAVTTSAADDAGWALTMSNGAVTSTYSTGSGTSTVLYTLSRTVNSVETGTDFYTQPTNGVEDLVLNDMATMLSPLTVINQSTQGQVATPSIDPGDGPYFGPLAVTVSTPTTGATIHYTTNGTTPTAASPVFTTLSLSTSTTVKAIATKPGSADSAVDTATYEIGTWATTSLWKSFAVPQQLGTFLWSFKWTPGAANIDNVIGLGPNQISGYTDMGPILRFNAAGQIDARNNDADGYGAETVVNYTAGTQYTFNCTVNVLTRTFSATVTPQGGSTSTIATNYPFRAEQASVTELDNVGFYGISGVSTISQMTIGSDTTAPTPNPMTFAVIPTAVDSFSVTMTASTATDSQSPPVAYNFWETTGHLGATASGWQSGTVYVDSGLSPGTQYTYYVWAKDGNENQGSPSTSFSVTTPTVVPPGPGSVNCNTLNVTTLRVGP